MKIWVIGRGYPLPKNRLLGSFELEQAKMLAAKGHEVTYFALVFHPFCRVYKWGLDCWQENGVNIRIFCAPSLPARFGIQLKPYRNMLWKRFLRLEKDELPDVLHLHYPSMICQPDVLEGFRLLGVKIVCTEHWSKVLLNQLRAHESARLVWHMQNADEVLSVGKPLAEAMKRISKCSREISVIPNVINPIFKPSISRTDDGVFRFVTVGRLIALRQYDNVIKAFDSVFHGRRDVTLTLVGNGEEYDKLAQLVSQLNAQDNIFLTGVKKREECAETVANSDCLICYSRYETFGVPVIEAWACGIPVIVSEQIGFLQGAEGGKLGISADAEAIDELKSALRRMLELKGQYDAAYIADYAQRHFSEETVYRMLFEAYGKAEDNKQYR